MDADEHRVTNQPTPPPATLPPAEFIHAGQRVLVRSSEDLTGVADESVDFILTSPPYWDLKDYGHTDQIGGKGETYEEYLMRLNRVFAECYRVAKPNAVLVVNVANRRIKKRFYPLGADIAANLHAFPAGKPNAGVGGWTGAPGGWRLWDQVIWYIPNALPQPNHYRERLLDNKYENLMVFTKDGSSDYTFNKARVPQKYAADPRAGKQNPNGRCLGNIIRIPAYRPPNVRDLGYHVAAYPEELAAFLISCYTNPGDTVLDPFLGSGTSLKVARHLGRSGIGVELNPDFEPLIKARLDEPFQLPDWRSLDILHSATNTPGSGPRRRAQA